MFSPTCVKRRERHSSSSKVVRDCAKCHSAPVSADCKKAEARTGLFINFLAEMARRAKQTLESRPETNEIIEKETSEAEANATPAITGMRERYT